MHLSKRVFALISVPRAERHTQMLARDFLKPRQMFARSSGIALALKRPRQPEFRRRMVWRQRQPLLKRRYGLVILLNLAVQVADKIIRIRFAGRDFRDVLESGNSFFRIERSL